MQQEPPTPPHPQRHWQGSWSLQAPQRWPGEQVWGLSAEASARMEMAWGQESAEGTGPFPAGSSLLSGHRAPAWLTSTLSPGESQLPPAGSCICQTSGTLDRSPAGGSVQSLIQHCWDNLLLRTLQDPTGGQLSNTSPNQDLERPDTHLVEPLDCKTWARDTVYTQSDASSTSSQGEGARVLRLQRKGKDVGF